MPSLKKHMISTRELHQKLASVQRDKIDSFKAKMDARRSLSDKIADALTDSFGTVLFLSINALWFGVWIVINTGLIPGIAVFDPFPFGLLTMIVSLEAIFLAVIVLISQNRSARIDDLREEIDLQINVRTEAEVTKILIILDRIHDHLGLPSEDDAELIMMKQNIDLDAIAQTLTKEMIEE
ncbi:MAG: DUF1003 domain-containing protein [Candidatus Peregrinibacteria bacterium]|nr:DUF1003 domain-containing protein [Candidatus Peregrinibacteria bacterium]